MGRRARFDPAGYGSDPWSRDSVQQALARRQINRVFAHFMQITGATQSDIPEGVG